MVDASPMVVYGRFRNLLSYRRHFSTPAGQNTAIQPHTSAGYTSSVLHYDSAFSIASRDVDNKLSGMASGALECHFEHHFENHLEHHCASCQLNIRNLIRNTQKSPKATHPNLGKHLPCTISARVLVFLLNKNPENLATSISNYLEPNHILLLAKIFELFSFNPYCN